MRKLKSENNKINKEADKGSATLEAVIIIPIFMFAMLALLYFAETVSVESVVYEAAIETAEYMAEYAYFTENIRSDETQGVLEISLAEMKLEEYLDDKSAVKKYVKNGINGINLDGSLFPDEEGYVILNCRYKIVVEVPFIGTYERECEEIIRQKAYLGYEKKAYEDVDEYDRYVYVAENGEVYHSDRNCSHLLYSIRLSNYDDAVSAGYDKCHYCGNEAADWVYVTDEGYKYHSTLNCGGLKRTVYRIKISEAGGLPKCQRCN